jgi:hypothetical protein
MRSERSKLIIILLVAAGALVVIGSVAGVLYLLARQPRPTAAGWQDPIASTLPQEVAPDLALYPLAGAGTLDTIDAALADGELETAYAILVFSPEPTDPQRIGRLLLLGREFAAQGMPGRAGLCYQQAYDIAILAPNLNDPARADALLAVGRGWAELGEEARALDSFDQVLSIAIVSPHLQLAQRRELLQILSTAFDQVGAEDQAEHCRQQIRDLDLATGPQAPARQAEYPLLPVGMEVVSSAEVGMAEEERRQAAYALLEALTSGGEPPADLAGRLATALLAEDQVKMDLYQQELEARSQPGRRAEVLLAMIDWLLVKYQTAEGGWGLSVVPQWDAEAVQIKASLTRAYEDLFFAYEDLVAGLPEAGSVDPGAYQLRRRIVLAGRLGQYPSYPEQELVGRLQDAAVRLMAASGVDGLYVDSVENGGYRFVLNSRSTYGRAGDRP